MPKLVAGCVLSLLLCTAAAHASRGPVTHRVRLCDWFLVETPTGFVLMEWYGGNDPERDDQLVGELESYGFKNIYNVTADQELRVWVEEFMLSKDRALEELYEKCD